MVTVEIRRIALLRETNTKSQLMRVQGTAMISENKKVFSLYTLLLIV